MAYDFANEKLKPFAEEWDAKGEFPVETIKVNHNFSLNIHF